jgi:hemerythrin HHE cation binding domain-containing protein
MIAGHEASSSGLYGALTFHHAQLETLARHALSMCHLEGGGAAQSTMSQFERELDAHLEAEERWLLPAFARTNPVACDAIMAEHARLRVACNLCAAALDAETIDERPIHVLLELLGDHCRREEAELYRWAETSIDEATSRAVIQKIEGAENVER